MTASYALFDTAIGPCGIAWNDRGVLGIQLPEATESRTRARLLARFTESREAPPPAHVQRAMKDIVAVLRGEDHDLSDIALDMDRVPLFNQRVYEIARAIPTGCTLTYGEIAKQLGTPEAARDVGRALGENPFPIIVPCHRVLAAGGKLGGFSANGGVNTKRRLLEIEGALAVGGRTLWD
jgi:methylated-DNA-[protein]-cysteine S-methyltransferase